jgi:isoleucyl-tRNA synthetase
MPFAQVHYPFENREWFDAHYPGDFIVEYIGQTRGWFYTLHVLAVALFDRPAFKTCLVHGILLGDDAQKLSKRLRNYPDPEAMFAAHGADAMRWFLMSSPVVRGGDMITDEKGITDAVRRALLPLWNAWYFFSLYANADQRRAVLGRTGASATLDRYILSKAGRLIETVTSAMEVYDLSGACAGIEAFLDVLNNWYIRRSRDRFWGTGSGDEISSQDAFDTLGTVLEVVCRVGAPLLPLVTETVWRGLTGADSPDSSVHLADWPDASSLPSDPDLVRDMDRVREVCSAAHSIRKARGLRARLPLAGLTVAAPDADRLSPYVELIADELNVKTVVLTENEDRFASRRLTVVFKVAAPRLGPATQPTAAAAKGGDWELLDGGQARVGNQVLEPGEFELRVQPVDETTTRALSGHSGLVVVDVNLNDALVREGVARDLVRAVQQHRRDLSLDVTDRIRLEVSGPAQVVEAIGAHEAWISEQVLAKELIVVAAPASEGWHQADMSDQVQVKIRITRLPSP